MTYYLLVVCRKTAFCEYYITMGFGRSLLISLTLLLNNVIPSRNHCFAVLPTPPLQVTMFTIFKQFPRCLVVLASMWTAGSCHEHYLDAHYRYPFSVEGWIDQSWSHRGSLESNAHAADADQSNVTYSVIVLSPSTKPSSQFLDEQRVRFFSPFPGGSGVVSVQFVDLPTRWPQHIGRSPFHIRHPDGVDKRVRMVFLRRDLDSWPASEVRKS